MTVGLEGSTMGLEGTTIGLAISTMGLVGSIVGLAISTMGLVGSMVGLAISTMGLAGSIEVRTRPIEVAVGTIVGIPLTIVEPMGTMVVPTRPTFGPVGTMSANALRKGLHRGTRIGSPGTFTVYPRWMITMEGRAIPATKVARQARGIIVARCRFADLTPTVLPLRASAPRPSGLPGEGRKILVRRRRVRPLSRQGENR